MAIRKRSDARRRAFDKEITRCGDFDARLRTLIDDMIETLHKKEGVGTPRRRASCVSWSRTRKPRWSWWNPEILERSGAVEGMEGCLSVPDVWGIVVRPDHVVVRAQDRDGNVFQFSADGYAARIVCHEVDHLDGVLFTERSYRFLSTPTRRTGVRHEDTLYGKRRSSAVTPLVALHEAGHEIVGVFYAAGSPKGAA